MGWLLLALVSAFILGVATLVMKRDVMHETETQTLVLYSLSGALLLPLISRIEYRVILTPMAWLFLVKGIVLSLALSISAWRRSNASR